MTKLDKSLITICTLLFAGLCYLNFNPSLVYALLPFPTSNKAKIAKLKNINKGVYRKSFGLFNWTPAQDDQELFVEDRILTGENSSAQIQFDDGSTFTLNENSLISLSPFGKGTLFFESGSTSFSLPFHKKVRLGKNQQPFEISSPNGSNEDVLLVRNQEGQVEFHSSGPVNIQAKGKEYKKLPNQSLTLDKNGVPSVTQHTHNFKTTQKLEALSQNQESFELKWSPKINSKNTYLEVAQSTDFKKKIYKENVFNKASTRLGFQKIPQYARLIDAGKSISQTLLIPAQKIKIADLQGPTNNKIYLLKKNGQYSVVTFQWQNAPKNSEFQLSNTNSFEKVLYSQNADSGKAKIKLRPGTYFWKVQGIKKSSQTRAVEIVNPNAIAEAAATIASNLKSPTKSSIQILPTSRAPKVREVANTEPEASPPTAHTKAASERTPDAVKKTEVNQPSLADNKVIKKKIVYDLVSPELDLPGDNTAIVLADNELENSFIFSWKASEGASSYVFQTSNDPYFKRKLSVQAVKGNFTMLTLLPKGKLYWRVRAKDGKSRSKWSKPRTIIVQGK